MFKINELTLTIHVTVDACSWVDLFSPIGVGTWVKKKNPISHNKYHILKLVSHSMKQIQNIFISISHPPVLFRLSPIYNLRRTHKVAQRRQISNAKNY